MAPVGLVLFLLSGPALTKHSLDPRAPASASRRRFALDTSAAAIVFPRLALLPLLTRSAIAAADGAPNGVTTAPDGAWRFAPGAEFVPSPSLMKTHAEEFTYKYAGTRASEWKYFKAGLTIDPVRIDSLKAFDTAAGVGERIVKAEMAKGGILDVKLEAALDEPPFYRLRYVVDSAERGKKRYVSRVAVADRKLIVLTCEAYVRYWDDAVEGEVNRIIDSLELRSPTVTPP
jgi:hypothetical protein